MFSFNCFFRHNIEKKYPEKCTQSSPTEFLKKMEQHGETKRLIIAKINKLK
jgi:hypothetical protein